MPLFSMDKRSEECVTWSYPESQTYFIFPMKKEVQRRLLRYNEDEKLADALFYPKPNKRGLAIIDVYEITHTVFDIMNIPDGLAPKLLADGIRLYCDNDNQEPDVASVHCEFAHSKMNISVGSRMICLALVLGADPLADVEGAKKALCVAECAKNTELVKLLFDKKVPKDDNR